MCLCLIDRKLQSLIFQLSPLSLYILQLEKEIILDVSFHVPASYSTYLAKLAHDFPQ